MFQLPALGTVGTALCEQGGCERAANAQDRDHDLADCAKQYRPPAPIDLRGLYLPLDACEGGTTVFG
ncbi:hypothetical protein GCM10009533_53550 [Saccharopolyspora spinosporotrichia]|uniref:Uncharacterized protein n=1 Tax=Saccharopolyspora erythraea TaxID=1836 RepID=A0ABN1DNH2_SACER